MTNETILRWFPYAFPFFFVGMWLLITTMLGLMSGWFNLQQWYRDDGSEEPLLKLGSQSGSMGLASFNGCLALRAYPSGLGITVWRIFGPFQKPLRVPWSEIDAEPSSSFFMPMIKLQLGKPANGTLKISSESWSQLIMAVKPTASAPLPYAPPIDRVSTRKALFIQWLAITAVAGSFFYFATRSWPDPVSPLFAFGFPAVSFGILLAIRFARA